MKVTFPAMIEGQDGWEVFGCVPDKPIYKPDNRKWYEKLVYKILMRVHDKAEDFWHWCYYTAQRYAPPSPIETYRYIPVKFEIDEE